MTRVAVNFWGDIQTARGKEKSRCTRGESKDTSYSGGPAES